MASVNKRNLTLTKVGTDQIRIDVTYEIAFSRFERNLAELGMIFREAVEVIGVDPPGSTTGRQLHVLAAEKLSVPAVNDGLPLQRNHSLTVSRASLDEDPGTFIADDDEIRCRIRILSIGIPAVSTDAFTNQQILFEDGGINP